jgi:TatD DNase family protein
MTSIPYIDIHSHSVINDPETIFVQNIYPGERFAAFSGRNFYSVGLHPWHIKIPDENNKLLEMVEDALEFDHVIFIGECGLDKKAKTNFEEQRRVFNAQAFMAEEFQKPLIIHCVSAFNEVLELHKTLHPSMPWIMHRFSGNIQITKQLENRNILFSFGENLFYKNSKAIDSFLYLPLNKILFETDECKRNVEEIYQQASILKNISIDLLKQAVWDNFNRIEKKLLFNQ